VALERRGGGAGEADISGLDRRRLRVRRRQPEDRIGAVERGVDHRRISVRALDDLDTRTDLGRELRRVAVDHAERLTTVEQVGQDLMADLATRAGDDDHRVSRL
jgi:hypothetical protein